MNHGADVSTRKMILTMLKTKGPLSVSEMTRELGITEMAVRRHLNTLERDNLIASELVRQAMGRPMNQYSLTEHAEDLFPKKYQHLTLDLLEELESALGEDKVNLLFERRKQRLIRRYENRMEGKSWWTGYWSSRTFRMRMATWWSWNGKKTGPFC